MNLNRRSFLSWLAAGGAAAAVGPRLYGRANADEPVVGPFFLFVNASGGWDPTMLCDPTGRASEAEADPINHFDAADIEQVGAFKVAPIDGHVAFFERFKSDLLVLNGVDTQTNSHEIGSRFMWSGSIKPGFPSEAALVAAAREPRPALAFLSNGGYDVTDGLVAPTRIPDTSAILEIAYPDRLDKADDRTGVLPLDILARLDQARTERLQRQLDAATLPRLRHAMASLQIARVGNNDLARLSAKLPSALDTSGNPLKRQAQVAMACFAAGVSASATMEIGNFDTHGDHDRIHTQSMKDIVAGITFAMDEAERQGIADKVVVIVGSDFGRTPYYNDTAGKDHWPITSMLLMGPGIRGGRVLGGTDGSFAPTLLDPTTLAPSSSGIRITPAHVHASLRALSGVATWEGAAPYGVGDALPLFT
jgi:uncharacterized protein (DUF1501 family)